jgi:hypothetical protein
MKKKTRSQTSAKRTSAKRISEDGAERTVQHLSLPPELVGPMRRLSEGKGERIGAVWDAACSAFAEEYVAKSCNEYRAPYRRRAEGSDYTTLWIDSRILLKCRKIAERDRVSLSRVLHTAAVLYLEKAR